MVDMDHDVGWILRQTSELALLRRDACGVTQVVPTGVDQTPVCCKRE